MIIKSFYKIIYLTINILKLLKFILQLLHFTIKNKFIILCLD
jgi:hypothetical protein